MSGPGRQRLIMVLLVAVCVLAVGTATIVVVLKVNEADAADSSPIDPARLLDERQLGLVRGAVPSPACAAEQTDAPADPSHDPSLDPSLVPLDVMRVVGTCLSTTTEYLHEADVEARRKELGRDPAVVVAAVAPPSYAAGGDDRRGEQWALDRLGVPANSSQAPWPDGTGVTIAVIDTGVDATHPDLAGAVIARRHYFQERELDPDGHGTNVAGIIGARRDNGGVVGVAPGVSILDVPVRLDEGKTNKYAPWWASGLAWSVNHGADAANLSLGGSLADYQKPKYREALEFAAAAVEFATDHDVVVVAAGGNCGSFWSGCSDRNRRVIPAAIAGVLAVGAVQKESKLAWFSTKNEDIDILAPGADIMSDAPGGRYKPMDGTSQATPHVTAAAAIGRYVNPSATATTISSALTETADLDQVAAEDRGKLGVGSGLLDIPGMVDKLRAGATGTTPGGLADRTQIAYVKDGTLFAFDGSVSHPVRRVDPAVSPRLVQWSADHTLLVGADDHTLFSWAGPGSKVVEIPCDWCADDYGRPALVENAAVTDPGAGAPTGDLILRMAYDGTLTRYNAHTLDEIGSSRPALPEPGDKSLHGVVGGKLVVHASGGAHASETLWLVDPVSGQVGASHDVAGAVRRPAAVNAAGDRIAVVTGYSRCGQANALYVLDARLDEVARPNMPAGMMVDDLFFNGGTLYAGMSLFEAGSPGKPCHATRDAGLWRLTDGAWQPMDPNLTAGRPFEGRTAAPATGWLAVPQGVGLLIPPAAVFDPPGAGDPDDGEVGNLGDLGAAGAPGGQLWSTPTRTEVPWPPTR